MEVDKKLLIDTNNADLTINQQCELIDLSRSTYYYKPRPLSKEMLELMNVVDEEYTKYPYFGTRRMAEYLKRKGFDVGRKKIRAIYYLLGLEAIYPKPRLSDPNKQHKIYPYLLRNIEINDIDEVWSTDITYIRLRHGFVYLVAVIDWYSRYVLDWEISTSLDAEFCIETLRRCLNIGRCKIFNTDQGAQFTSNEFTDLLLCNDIKISMDGVGRALDNVFVERLWRSVKQECVYIHEFESVAESIKAISEYFKFYNKIRPHQSLNYKTPAEIYLEKCKVEKKQARS